MAAAVHPREVSEEAEAVEVAVPPVEPLPMERQLASSPLLKPSSDERDDLINRDVLLLCCEVIEMKEDLKE